MSPIPTHRDRGTAVAAGSIAARLIARTDTMKFGEQFAWPPNEKSLAFWLAIFIMAPVTLILVGWLIWQCKWGNHEDDDFKAALREERKQKKKEAKKKQSQLGISSSL